MIAVVRREFVRSRNDHRDRRKYGGKIKNLSMPTVPLINFCQSRPGHASGSWTRELHGYEEKLGSSNVAICDNPPPRMWCSPDWKELNLDPKRVHVEKEVEIRLRSVVAEVSRR
jgi:hypothetical protein